MNGVPAQAGRPATMDSIVAEYEGALLRYAMRLVNSRASAEDVVQNVFIKLFRRWREGDPEPESLKSWLYRVTHNEAVDHIRRESRLRLLHERREDEVRGSDDVTVGSDRAVNDDERKQRVLDLLGKLQPREQQVILLRLQEGLSYQEISTVTGRTEGNVGNILHHAVRKLSQALRRSGALQGV
jgi:RNA polymerase sigma factor (sigma-70 family)